MTNRPVTVVSIHDKVNGFMSFDVWEILGALGSDIDDYYWVVNIRDWEGRAEALPDGGVRGEVMTTSELRTLCQPNFQTIDGEFAGGLLSEVEPYVTDCRPDLRRFGETSLRIGILAVECDFFVVWTREERHVQALRNCFKDVRSENPRKWCDA